MAEQTGNTLSGDELQVRIDAQQFARAGHTLAGEVGMAAFERLSAECDSEEIGARAVRWALQGSVDAEGVCWLSLDVTADVPMQCQRCLGSVVVEAHGVSRFRLVFAGEEWGDEDLEDDSFEALEIDGPLDLATLVEDEVLLALPTVPTHTQCAMPAKAGEQVEPVVEKRPSPFAVLEKLKRN
ncbi:YceD family protein [Methyloversatilis universalis]|uniref:YceD family protein n=1 Tax=Methyloversatilis universalis TaxID=378211 RepID=UPI00037D9BD2|nr:YceD family protein [Methyloversatilis universalis]